MGMALGSMTEGFEGPPFTAPSSNEASRHLSESAEAYKPTSSKSPELKVGSFLSYADYQFSCVEPN